MSGADCGAACRIENSGDVYRPLAASYGEQNTLVQ